MDSMCLVSVRCACYAASIDPTLGSADSQYLAQADGDRQKRKAIGVYEQSGLSEYTVAPGSSPLNNSIVIGPQGENFVSHLVQKNRAWT